MANMLLWVVSALSLNRFWEEVMVHRSVLMDWVRDALVAHGGQARIVQVSKHIWENHEKKLRDSGELFYTWQYDFRWAAERLRKKKIMKPADESPKGIWELA
ncbi:hypothetical protein [Azospirillum baldaniorum]|uniref:hypothetical protein n=1 Tax=Azospirillum baldaniorum TaxID=1064539 RepID=UPI001B3B5B6B|nr:hypothetical protein [Azospirillum baldaniorum]